MKRSVSMQTIADRLGVSKFAVSQALSGKPGVSETTRRRIIEMAETLDYRVPPARAGRPKGNSPEARGNATDSPPSGRPMTGRTVLVLARRTHVDETMYWRRVLQGIVSACRGAGLEAHLANEDASTAFAADPAGVIALGEWPPDTLLALRGGGRPIVLVDHEEPLLRADVVLNDNMEAARIACKHLFARGCASVAFVGRDRFAVSFRSRWWGCKVALEEWKKAHPSTECALLKWTVPYPDQTDRSIAKRLAELPPDGRPGGFVCANDDIAFALLRELRAAGIRVPEQCRVVGIDDVAGAAAADPPLSTVSLAKEELGARAVHALLRRMDRPHGVPEKIILSAELIVRSSG